MTHLAVHWWRSETKFLNKSHQGSLHDPAQVVGRLRDHCVVALLCLLLRHHRTVIWRSCRETRQDYYSTGRKKTVVFFFFRFFCSRSVYEGTLTLRLLGDGHAQPLQVDAVLAADAGRPAAEGMEGDGANNEGQLQTKLRRPGNIDTNLFLGGEIKAFLLHLQSACVDKSI